MINKSLFLLCVLGSIILNLKAVHSYEKVKPSNISQEILNHIFFLFHPGPTVNDFNRIPYEDGLSISEYSEFDKNMQTVFYLHGWTEKPSENEESVDTIASAFLANKKENLIVLDYSELVKGDSIFNYLRAVQNVTYIGQALGYFLQKYVSHVQSVEKVHLIGHSLGSQVMSRAANAFGRGKLSWLTALDPAGPLFNTPLIDHLTKEDAVFVDVIHTDGFGYGDGRSIGHVDFFPNLGTRVQPYCNYIQPYEFCSHHMSWRYYAESILNEGNFPAKKCELNLFCTRFTISWCCGKDAPITYMGYAVDKTARGDFYLKTNASEPFGLGVKGFYV